MTLLCDCFPKASEANPVWLSFLSAALIRSSRTLWRKCLFWLMAPGYSPQRRNQGIRSVKQLVLAHPQSGSREQQLHAAALFWLTGLRIPAREWCHLWWASLPNPGKVLKIFPHRHTQKPVSCKILDSAKLTSLSTMNFRWKATHVHLHVMCTFFLEICLFSPPELNVVRY